MPDALLIFEFRRWRVVLPQCASKGMSEDEARRFAYEHGGTASWSQVRVYDDGTEELGPWQPDPYRPT